MSAATDAADLRLNIARLDTFMNGAVGAGVELKNGTTIATLLGLVGSSASDTEPPITWPGRHWYDTVDPESPVLKIRDDDDAGWINLPLVALTDILKRNGLSTTLLENTELDRGVDRVRVEGETGPGQGPAVEFIRVVGQPAHDNWFRSADRELPGSVGSDVNQGGYWELEAGAGGVSWWVASADLIDAATLPFYVSSVSVPTAEGRREYRVAAAGAIDHDAEIGGVRLYSDPSSARGTVVGRLRAPSVTAWPGSSAADPKPVNSFGNVLYGYHAGSLYAKPTRSAAWSLVTAIPVSPVELMPTPDGEVVAVGTTTIRKSSGWGTGTVSWTTKVTNSGGTSTFNGFSIGHSEDGQHIIVGEYASGASGVGAGGRETGRFVWYSADGGASFATIYDSQTRYGAVAAAETHIHGCAYDEYQGNGVLYVIEGHDDGSGNVGGIYWSTNAGATWTRLENGETDVNGTQGGMPTSIVPVPGGLVCASDGPQQGVWHIERNGADPANNYISWAWRPGHGAAGITSFGRAHSIDRKNGTVYIGFSVNSSSIFYAPAFIIVSDGRSAIDAWTGTSAHVAPDVNSMANIAVTPWGTITSVSEGSAPIKVIGTIDERRGLDVRHLDRGQVLGGRVTSASRSLAVGSGSVAALNATAVGAFANADQASAIAIGAVSKALGVQAIAIGDQAEAGTGATAIGYLVKAGGNSVVISNNKDLAALTDVVAIGDDITVGFGATVTVGEGASNTNTSGTVVGRNASNTAVNGTAIGTAAVCEHTFSIALGRSSTTTKTNQVHIDARQITMKNLGTPSAPPAGEGQWFVRDNGAGKMQFCVQAPTGGALVLATEP